MRVDLLTREYPPHVYGGAGRPRRRAHPGARRTIDVRVHCFDGPRDEPGVRGTRSPPTSPRRTPRCRPSASTSRWPTPSGRVGADGVASDLVHSHTWYANLGGHLAGLLHGIPHVVTAHSLEPLRPWKAEQLGGGYALSSWAEKTAYEGAAAVIAVSGGMREDILRSYPSVDPDRVKVVHNGIDLDEWQRPTGDEALARADATVRALGIDPSRPSVVFVGRITRQKGLPYFLRAVELLPPDVQVVLCAGAPDTPEILAEVTGLVDELRTRRTGVVWIEQMLPRDELIAVLVARHRLRVPVGLRAARHRQPRGHGRRAARRGHRHRRHPGGHRRRRHGPPRADRPAAGRHRHARRPGGVRRRPGRGAHGRGERPRADARSGASRPGDASRTTSRGRPSPTARWTCTAAARPDGPQHRSTRSSLRRSSPGGPSGRRRAARSSAGRPARG